MSLLEKCSVLASMYETSLATSISGERVQVHSHIPPHDADLIHEVVSSAGSKRAIEVGMAFGASSLAILSASDSITLHSVDPFQSTQWQGCGVMSLISAGYQERHTLWEDYDYSVLPNLMFAEKYDFAFIDGWHTFDHAFLDWWYVDKMLDVGGIVGFDDCYMPAVEKTIHFLMSHRKYEEVYAGRSVRTRYFRKTSEHTPAWDFFVNF